MRSFFEPRTAAIIDPAVRLNATFSPVAPINGRVAFYNKEFMSGWIPPLI